MMVKFRKIQSSPTRQLSRLFFPIRASSGGIFYPPVIYVKDSGISLDTAHYTAQDKLLRALSEEAGSSEQSTPRQHLFLESHKSLLGTLSEILLL